MNKRTSAKPSQNEGLTVARPLLHCVELAAPGTAFHAGTYQLTGDASPNQPMLTLVPASVARYISRQIPPWLYRIPWASRPRNTDVQKLQRAAVDGLEGCEGQDIVVFNTEHLSPLFERVIIASGTSNRQTRPWPPASVRPSRMLVSPNPCIEGEGNAANGSSWITWSRCGPRHATSTSTTTWKRIWGGKVVHLKLGSDKRNPWPNKASRSQVAKPQKAPGRSRIGCG